MVRMSSKHLVSLVQNHLKKNALRTESEDSTDEEDAR